MPARILPTAKSHARVTLWRGVERAHGEPAGSRRDQDRGRHEWNADDRSDHDGAPRDRWDEGGANGEEQSDSGHVEHQDV